MPTLSDLERPLDETIRDSPVGSVDPGRPAGRRGGRRPEQGPGPSKKTPKEQIQELSDAYEKAMRDYSRAYAKAATDEERTKARQMRPRADEYAARFLAIADAVPDDPAAVDALIRYVLLGQGDTSKR